MEFKRYIKEPSDKNYIEMLQDEFNQIMRSLRKLESPDAVAILHDKFKKWKEAFHSYFDSRDDSPFMLALKRYYNGNMHHGHMTADELRRLLRDFHMTLNEPADIWTDKQKREMWLPQVIRKAHALWAAVEAAGQAFPANDLTVKPWTVLGRQSPKSLDR
jgi:hypothetical protein